MSARKLTAFLLIYIGAVTFLSTGCATNSPAGQNTKAATPGFSFAVFGDSRTMMYLPHRSDQKADAVNYMVDMFELVMPEKVAREAVAQAVKLTYDPASGELVQIVMPFMTKSEVTTLTVDQGWVTEASVEDVKLLPGVRRIMFRLAGGDWVTHELVKAVKSGQADFALHTGDWVWWGKQGGKPSENPYWSRVKEVLLKQLPPPDDRLKNGGLDGRVFSAAGNHEVWEDPNAEGFLSTFDYLKKFGISDKQLVYKFDYNGVRFIFLWTGHYDYREPTGWVATRPAYEEQMKQLGAWLDEAKGAGIKKVFITFHNAVFCRSGMGGLPENQNPHKLLASYAKDLDIVVFNGHVHTTEVYDVEGVKYLVLGGGGAEQDPILPGRTHIKVPANYPSDQYWQNASPKEEYNYLLVDVRPGEKTKFTLNRFRPGAAKPFESVELYK
jgi:Calcineurin-like phosphoesterase